MRLSRRSLPGIPPWAAVCAVMALAGSTPVRSVVFSPPSAGKVTGSIPPAQPPRDRLQPLIPAEVVRVIDGDTVEMRVLIWLDQQVLTRVRLKDIDAPEFSARCPEEARLAVQATEALEHMLARQRLFLTDVTRDKYGGRVVARIVTQAGTDVGAAMQQGGHARAYAGSRRKGWCG